VLFPDLKPFHLFRVIRRPVIDELLAPVVNAIFWKIAMRYATGPPGEESNDVVEDFHAPFSGPLGAWRLMSKLSFRDPAEVLASILDRLPQHLMPTLFLRHARRGHT
jgi:hypothetical protein